ncbi:uncharacterized protein [Dermacentor albipictus]|uniref:uncharacterized protein isoform X2 n=1 Tax=Dermacentor albipictus TaxID=60249 RepID=UPI0038FD1EF8
MDYRDTERKNNAWEAIRKQCGLATGGARVRPRHRSVRLRRQCAAGGAVCGGRTTGRTVCPAPRTAASPPRVGGASPGSGSRSGSGGPAGVLLHVHVARPDAPRSRCSVSRDRKVNDVYPRLRAGNDADRAGD